MTDLEKVVAVIDLVASGSTVTTAIKIAGIDVSTFYKVKRLHPELDSLYAAARVMSAEVSADECQDIADDESISPERAKLRIQTRQWRASKNDAGKYGDRVNLTIDTTINIAQALADANSRVSSTTSAALTAYEVKSEIISKTDDV